MQEEKRKQVGCFALIISFLIPLVGVIWYFVKRKDVENPSAFLLSALGGMVVGIILRYLAS